MDKLTKYRDLIKQILTRYAEAVTASAKPCSCITTNEMQSVNPQVLSCRAS